jgi:beta-lactamase superfamily II metal-dependent hydrolase
MWVKAMQFLFSQGFEVLIDAGENNMGNRVVDYVKPKLQGNLDLVIATHPDSDHIGGMDTVLSQIKVDKIIDSGMNYTTQTYNDYMSEVNKQVNNGATYSGDSDMRITIGTGAVLDIIETGDNNGSKNNNSVVSKLTIGNVSCLLTGDMESEVEKEILDKDLKADILKAGHHGSRSSSSTAFLDKVAPQCALISAGVNNKYGHPHPETINSYETRNIPYYVTASLGNIELTTDGNSFTVGGKTYTGHSDGTPVTPDPGTTPVEPEEPTDPGTTPVDPGTEPSDPVTQGNMVITNVDSKAESVTLKNNSNKTIDLTGWYIFSTVGEQYYTFADGYKLEAGMSVQVLSGSAARAGTADDLIWTKSNVWADKNDPAELYDAGNNLIASFNASK